MCPSMEMLCCKLPQFIPLISPICMLSSNISGILCSRSLLLFQFTFTFPAFIHFPILFKFGVGLMALFIFISFARNCSNLSPPKIWMCSHNPNPIYFLWKLPICCFDSIRAFDYRNYSHIALYPSYIIFGSGEATSDY